MKASMLKATTGQRLYLILIYFTVYVMQPTSLENALILVIRHLAIVRFGYCIVTANFEHN
jgi:hypothetical protein